MPGEFCLVDTLKRQSAKISDYGEVKVAPYAYSLPYFQNMGTANTAYNFVPPKQDQFFVITGVLMQANKNVNASTAAVVDLYEADSATDLVIDTSVFQIEMVKNDRLPLVPLNIKVTEGKFLNGKTTDDDVLMTVTGYYVIC